MRGLIPQLKGIEPRSGSNQLPMKKGSGPFIVSPSLSMKTTWYFSGSISAVSTVTAPRCRKAPPR